MNGPNISRRRFLKLTGATGVAAGVASADHAGLVDGPIGEADAIAPIIAIGAATVAGAAAGAVITAWASHGTDVDPDGVLEDELYAVGNAINESREAYVDEVTNQFANRSADSTPYAHMAWSGVRSTVYKEAVNGSSSTQAAEATKPELRVQTSISLINQMEHWNNAVDAALEAITLDLENSVGVFQHSTQDAIQAYPDSEFSNWSPVEASEVGDGTGEYVVWQREAPLPADVEDIPERDEPLTVYGISSNWSGETGVLCPLSESDWGAGFTGTEANASGYFEATHSNADLDAVRLLNASLHRNAIASIWTEYDRILGGLYDYADQVVSGIAEGALDPSEVLSGRDLVDHFGSSDEVTRVAAEIGAMGGEIPADEGYRAEVSHMDLVSDRKWVWLFPQFGGASDPPPVAAGTTISSSDYEMAYALYENAQDGTIETEALSGDGDLTIHNLDDVEGQLQVDETDRQESAGTNGRVVVWEGESPPEPLEYRADYSDWSVVVTGASNTSNHTVGEIVEDNGQLVLETTSLNDGETVEEIDVSPPVSYEQGPARHVADPTDVSTEDEQALLEQMRDRMNELEDAYGSGGGAGGGIADNGGLIVGVAAALGGGYLLTQNNDGGGSSHRRRGGNN